MHYLNVRLWRPQGTSSGEKVRLKSVEQSAGLSGLTRNNDKRWTQKDIGSSRESVAMTKAKVSTQMSRHIVREPT